MCMPEFLISWSTWTLPSCLWNKKKISCFFFCVSFRTRNGILGGKYRAVLWIRSDGRCLFKVLQENE